MLGVRRGFVDKSSISRHHSDRYRHFERRVYSDNHPRRHRSVDDEKHVSVRGYRDYYRRDSAAHGLFPFVHQINLFPSFYFLVLINSCFQFLVAAPSHKYGRTNSGTRFRESYAESRYSSKYPRDRQEMHEEHMGRDAYRRSKYGNSYHDRVHRTSCPECNLSGQNCDYPNGEEFSATSGEQAYYKTVRATVQLLVFYYLQLEVDHMVGSVY